MRKLLLGILFFSTVLQAQTILNTNGSYAVIVRTDTLKMSLFIADAAVITNANEVGGMAYEVDTISVLDSLSNYKEQLPSLPLTGLVEKNELYNFGDELCRIVQSHNRTTVNHFNPHDVPALYRFTTLASGCGDAKEWTASDHWTTYELDELRTNNSALYKVINVGYTYYEPSGTNGHYGWEFIENCN